jgi:predicted MPP superfamily phosphohydrolase
LWVAFAACACVTVADHVLLPIYVRGGGQSVVSHVNSLSTLLSTPAVILIELPGLRVGRPTSIGVWLAMQALTFAFWTIAGWVLLAVWERIERKLVGRARLLPSRPLPPANEDGSSGASSSHTSEVRVTRRVLILHGAGAAVGSAAIAYPMSIVTRRFEITRRSLAIRDLHPNLAGLRLVQISDVHHGPWIPLSHVRQIVQTANALSPDVILLTGDYVHRSPAYITPVVETLSKLRATIGIVAVLGNHDWWEDGPLMQREFARVGIPLIDNTRRFITPDRALVDRATEGLCLAGVGDLYTDIQRYGDALGDVPSDMPRLLLSHNPDVAEVPELAAHRVDLMLSGHTHGGQIYVPGLGTPIVPSMYGQKYARGLVQGPTCPVFVCRGLGHTVLPVRVGVRPEMAVIELECG